MKKLLFIALFSIGLFTVSNAQMLGTVTNNSPYGTDFKMGDASGVNGLYIPFIAPFGGTSPANFTSPLVFPLQFGATNSLGCTAFQSVVFAPSAGATPFTCFVFSTMSYTLVPFGPFFILNVVIA